METIFVNKETKEALIKVYDLYTKDDIKTHSWAELEEIANSLLA